MFSHWVTILQGSYVTGLLLTAHRFGHNRPMEKWEKWEKWGKMGKNGGKWGEMGGNGGKWGCGALVRASPLRATCLLSL